jgi:hypothetical protein
VKPTAPKRYKSRYKPATQGARQNCKGSYFHDLGSKDEKMGGEDAVLCGFDQLDPQYPFCRYREWYDGVKRVTINGGKPRKHTKNGEYGVGAKST